MAQLSDDCFAFGGPLLTVADAERIIGERLSAVDGVERVALSNARGRVLAADCVAGVALPPFDNSAVDGYAVRFSDLAASGETRCRVTAAIFAGGMADAPVGTGDAVRIFTGAPMPPGADTVFMQEDCRTESQTGGDFVILPAGLKRGANRRLSGEDVALGSVALPAGRRLGPQHIALLSAIGVTHVDVRRRIRVALFSTGDEIADPGQPLKPGQIYDANRPLLAEMARTLGCEVTDLGILKDDVAALTTALKAAAETHDLVLTSGGVSTGDADYVRTAVEAFGSLVFWRVAIKPGRPVALAVLPGASAGHQAAFAGLPGNPVAAFVTFARIVRPMLLRLSGALAEPLVALPVRANFSYKKKAGRREYVRVSLQTGSDGVTEAVKYRQDGAGVISSITATCGLIELPEDQTSVEPGMTAGYLSYAAIMGSL